MFGRPHHLAKEVLERTTQLAPENHVKNQEARTNFPIGFNVLNGILIPELRFDPLFLPKATNFFIQAIIEE